MRSPVIQSLLSGSTSAVRGIRHSLPPILSSVDVLINRDCLNSGATLRLGLPGSVIEDEGIQVFSIFLSKAEQDIVLKRAQRMKICPNNRSLTFTVMKFAVTQKKISQLNDQHKLLGVTANFETEGALSAPTFNSDTGLKLLEGYVSCIQQSEDGELSFIPAKVGEWPLRGIIDSGAELDHVLSALWFSHEEVKLAWKLNLNSEEFDRLFAVSLEVTLCFRALQVFFVQVIQNTATIICMLHSNYCILHCKAGG